MGPPDEPPHDVSRLIAVERSRLLDLLRGLAPSDWDLPTPCPTWSVHALCCHLVGGDLGVLARGRDGHFGTIPPPGDEAQFIAWLDDLQREWVRAARRMSPRTVIDLLSWSGPQLAAHFAAQDGTARTADVSWAGAGPMPVWLDQLRELSEYWIHRQQLLDSLEQPNDLSVDVAGPVLDGLRWAYPYRLAAVDADVGDTVTIEIGPPIERNWYLLRVPEGWVFATTPGTHVLARLEISTSEAWRLLTNNLSPDRQATLALDGRADVVNILRRTRAIIGAPNCAEPN